MNKLIVFFISILAVSFLGAGCGTPLSKSVNGEGANVPADVSARIADWKAAKAVVENKLSGWVAFQKTADPTFSLDEFKPQGIFPIQGETLSAGLREFDASRTRLQTASPNGKLLLDPYAYYDLIQKGDSVYSSRDVDSAVRVLDQAKKTSWQVLMCGTPCNFDAAAWINDSIIVVVGNSETNVNNGSYETAVEVIDLDKKSLSAFKRSAPKRPENYFQTAFPDIKQ